VTSFQDQSNYSQNSDGNLKGGQIKGKDGNAAQIRDELDPEASHVSLDEQVDDMIENYRPVHMIMFDNATSKSPNEILLAIVLILILSFFFSRELCRDSGSNQLFVPN